ncbi:tryptophan biosynthesis modulator TrpM [Streptomyces sp. NPDC058459]|uniref:tryptophan biosynthesis modulator TrpM n=1 Tax=Streptomyces sp. NPDC058459 TaxID=3346508 RepID=UPI00364EFD29
MTPALTTTVDRHARLARGCRPRGCRAPARRVHGRRVRYHIGAEPGQVNGMRWRQPTCGGEGHRSMLRPCRVGVTSH